MFHAILLALLPAAPGEFTDSFTGKTLRFDYQHCGTTSEEHIAPDGFRLEGDWPGSRTHLLDDTNLGLYRFSVVDAATQQELYSRGFASIFGEWQSTGEAKTTWRSFEESQRFPEPKKSAQLVLKKRGEDGAFHELATARLDPTSRFVDRAPAVPQGEVIVKLRGGEPATHVDLLVLAEGYTLAERAKFAADFNRLTDVMFSTEPFLRHKADFNVSGLFVPSAQSGISNPRKDVWRSSPFGLSFNAFDTDRYVLTFENRALREIASQAPYDALIVLFNDRKYGGGGIFNLWATCASDTEPAPYVFVHEFGHSFAGLADEYYTSQVAYETFNPAGVEPWEPNVTALLDPQHVKWGDLVGASTPLPTPWEQKRYDEIDLQYQARRKKLIEEKGSEEATEALMREAKTATAPLLASEKHYGQVGAFEGAMYQAKGLYRPEVDCIMFTRNPTRFCKVCERAIERVIRLYAE
jgi:IgA peptidase M64/peptidase M64-like protein